MGLCAEIPLPDDRTIEVWKFYQSILEPEIIYNVFLKPDFWRDDTGEVVVDNRFGWRRLDELAAQAIIYHLLDTYGGNGAGAAAE